MARSGFASPSRRDRTELLPVALDAGSGQLVARPAGQTGSHRLMPLLAADAVAIVPPADVPFKSGDPLEVLPFRDPDFQGVLP
jgi:molybdopterin molybdotransferase